MFKYILVCLIFICLLGCGISNMPQHSSEEPIPGDKIILMRHFGISSKAYEDGKYRVYKTRDGNVMRYKIMGPGAGVTLFHYSVIYELVDGYWKYVTTIHQGHM
ncbi:MAG: hypothetical protein OXI43_10050 [Candidatus Poribacteria bacterium]|nr:hypothetical protein [Candidatus Poribacteria bacterium]